jgi:hypothetical protein
MTLSLMTVLVGSMTMKKTKANLKALKKLNREDPTLQVKPTIIQGDRRTKRNRTRTDQNRKAIQEQVKDSSN